MLSPLQQRVASIIGGIEGAQDFALAGGAALIVHGEIDRRTRDIDFFALDPRSVEHVVPAAERALKADGLRVERQIVTPRFARLAIADGADATEVDFGVDARLFPFQGARGGQDPGSLWPCRSS